MTTEETISQFPGFSTIADLHDVTSGIHHVTKNPVSPVTSSTDRSTVNTNNVTFSPYDFGDGLFVHPHWLQFDIFNIPEFYHYILGVYTAFVSLTGVIGNFIIIWIFISVKSLRTPPNMFIINLAVSDLMSSVINGFPLLTISSFYRRWIFGKTGCLMYGFLGGLAGFGSINTLAWIAMDRYYVIAKPFSALKNISHRRAAIQIVFIWLWSLAWSAPPLIGWGDYILEGLQTSCSFDYLTKTTWNISFVASIYCFGFLTPVSIITVCYVNIVRAVSSQNRSMSKKAEKLNAQEKKDSKKNKQEIQLAKTAATTILLFLLSWIPYASVALLGITGYEQYVTPITSILPVMFAKTSAIYNPILYAITHPKFRAALRTRLPYLFLCCPEEEPDKAELSQSTARNGSKAAKGDNNGKRQSKKNAVNRGGLVRQSTRESYTSEVSIIDDSSVDALAMANVSKTNNSSSVSENPEGRNTTGPVQKSEASPGTGDPNATVDPKHVQPQIMFVNPNEAAVMDPRMVKNFQPGPGQPYIMYYPPVPHGLNPSNHTEATTAPPIAVPGAPPGVIPQCTVYTTASDITKLQNGTQPQELNKYPNGTDASKSVDKDQEPCVEKEVQETSFSCSPKRDDNDKNDLNKSLPDKNEQSTSLKEEGVTNKAFEND